MSLDGFFNIINSYIFLILNKNYFMYIFLKIVCSSQSIKINFFILVKRSVSNINNVHNKNLNINVKSYLMLYYIKNIKFPYYLFSDELA